MVRLGDRLCKVSGSFISRCLFRSYQDSFLLTRRWAFMWRLTCLDSPLTRDEKLSRQRRPRATPSTLCGTRSPSSSKKYGCFCKRSSVARRAWINNGVVYGSGGFAHTGVPQDSRVWRGRQVHRPSHHPRLSHSSGWESVWATGFIDSFQPEMCCCLCFCVQWWCHHSNFILTYDQYFLFYILFNLYIAKIVLH